MKTDNKEVFLKIGKSLNLILGVGFILAWTINVILGLALYNAQGEKSRTLIPAYVSSAFTVSDNNVDERYLHMMGEYFIDSRFDVTPANVDRKYKQLLDYVRPESWSEIQPVLEADAKEIKKLNIASNYAVGDVSVNLEHLQVRVTGILHKSVSARDLEPEPRNYIVQMNYSKGMLSLVSIGREVE